MRWSWWGREGTLVSLGELAVAAVTIATLGCGAARDRTSGLGAREHYHLEEIRSFGLPVRAAIAGSTFYHDDGGGVLLGVAAIAVDASSDLYVLDSYFKKVVVFAPSGRVGRVILGGLGEGNGEFLLPRDLAVDMRGDVWVSDVANGRITGFDSTGRYLTHFTVDRDQIHRIATREDEIWISLIYGPLDSVSSVVYDRHGRFLRNGFPITGSRERRMEESGNPGMFGKTPGSRVIFGLGDPGVWLESDGDRTVRRGSFIFPSQAPTGSSARQGGAQGSARWPRAEIRGIGRLPGGGMAIMYGGASTSERGIPVGRCAIEFLDAEGAYLGTAHLDSTYDRSGSFTTSAVTGHLYIARASSRGAQVVEFLAESEPIGPPRDTSAGGSGRGAKR